MSIPFLPGYGSILLGEVNKTNFTKPQAFTFRNGVRSFEDTKPGIGGQILPNSKPSSPPQKLTKIRPQLPPELRGIKGVKFEAFFVEEVYNSVEKSRIRRCQIHFLLEDGSISVLEPKVKNSGIPQGILMKKTRVPKGEKSFLELEDLFLGAEVEIFGKRMTLTNTDHESRSIIEFWGLPLGEPIDIPEDPFTTQREQIDKGIKPRVSNRPPDSLKKFLEKDRQVLRFFVYWDDRNSSYGDFRKFKFHLFLADDTVEVVEQLKPNSGRDSFAVFIKRQKPPQGFPDIAELKKGGTVTLFARAFVIYDADDFTKKYLRENYNITDFTPLLIDDPEEQQTLQNSLNNAPLQPKAPKKQFQKMLDNDRKILRFSATLVSNKQEDKDRVFVVSYYLADDTVGIYEPPQRNSGVLGGKFLERRTVTKPDSNDPYHASEFFVGAVIQVYSRQFILHDADEYAFNYMEANPNEFPKSDIDTIQLKVQEAIKNKNIDLSQTFKEMDKDGNEFISLQEFRDALISLGFELTEQEIITLSRRYDLDNDGKISYQEFSSTLNL